MLATRREHRAARITALTLVAAGGLVATTAKVAYVPVLGAAVLVCAATAVGVRRPRRAGPAIAVVAALLAVAPVLDALERQEQFYASVNAHDLVFTTVLYELGPAAAGDLGLPPEAAALTGNGYFNGPPRPDGVAWWQDAIVARPTETRSAALALLAAHPAAALRAVGVGLQATTRADLPYLDSGPASPSRLASPSGDPGWSGARQPDLARVLDTPRRPPSLPCALVVVALAAAATARWQGRAGRWSLAAGLAAATALALIAVAVAGDGYFEVFKHVWLAAYLLAVAGLALAGAAVTALDVPGSPAGGPRRSRKAACAHTDSSPRRSGPGGVPRRPGARRPGRGAARARPGRRREPGRLAAAPRRVRHRRARGARAGRSRAPSSRRRGRRRVRGR